MSREVEVNNIQMTATVPEDIQISLGKLAKESTDASTAETLDNGVNLANSTGVLYAAADKGADDGNATDPGTDIWNWASSADISAYYQMGKLIPASSTTGEDIFFTPDAAGVGKTLKSNPKYYMAADARVAQNEKIADRSEVAAAANTNLRTTLHAFDSTTEKSARTWDNWVASTNETGYKASTAWNVTNDDGYYVDIPVWLRTSSNEDINLSVDAYVTAKNAANDGDDLYMAARVVVLHGSDGTEGTPYGGIIELRQDSYTGASVVNYMASTNATGEAVARLTNDTDAVYEDATRYSGNLTTTPANAIVLAHRTDADYGTATKVWLRVWLEGEDPNCWNSNAGQDFSINLKFVKGDTTSADSIEYTGKKATSEAGSLMTGDTVEVTLPEVTKGMGTVDNSTSRKLTYTYNADATVKWVRTSGTYYAPDADKTYKASGTAVGSANTTETELVSYITTTITTKDKATAGITLTQE